MVGGDHDAILTTENGRRSASRNALVMFWCFLAREITCIPMKIDPFLE